MKGARAILLVALAFGAGLGLLIAGAPWTTPDEPVRAVQVIVTTSTRPATTTTTTPEPSTTSSSATSTSSRGVTSTTTEG